jgi:hypothetical protein
VSRKSKYFCKWSIDSEVPGLLRDLGVKTVLMLGSGLGCLGMCERFNFKVYSLEEDIEYVDAYPHENHHCFHAPLEFFLDYEWYDTEVVRKIPKDYDAIIIDGPISYGKNRVGFSKWLPLFDTDVHMVFDDINREHEYKVALSVAKEVKRELVIKNVHRRKQFGFIKGIK